MPRLLAIEASPRGKNSVSRSLADSFVSHWQAAHPGGKIVQRDLIQAPPPFLDEAWIFGNRTPAAQRSSDMTKAMRISDELIDEVMTADHIMIGTPMINFAIPAILKAYVDQIVRIGATITPQFQGLLRDKRATAIVASGISYAPGSPWESQDAASSYLKQILNFLGISDVTLVKAGGTLAIDRGEMSLSDFKAQFDAQLAAAARP
jgi:FMN-dependent NADH-azoreductase